ncbi:MAG TPA: alpha/beta hydrolase [Anaeromyxobacteraceae bacterium]|nr:alpha/beta hydrolase [Anaeromyxobacteraceae bacterium]
MSGRNPIADLRGLSRLAVEATTGVTDAVEAMHHAIARAPGILGTPPRGRTRGITGLTYRSVRGMARLVGGGLDALLAQLDPVLGQARPSPRWESLISVLNGVVGDHLAASGSPLAIPMGLRRNGRALRLERRRLAAAIRRPGHRLLVLAHGLCMDDLRWRRLGHDHGLALARDLGYTPLYLRYNSGLHVSVNGRELADLLENLVGQWPAEVEELVILAHSLGGLVARSACHQGAAAGHRWPGHLRALVFLGTPHHGAGLERVGNLANVLLGISPYSAPIARLARLRSAGVTDLRHGSLLDEDWEGRSRFEHAPDRRRPVPLPAGARCYAIAATTAARGAGRRGALPGDGIVPLDSALGRHRDPALTLPLPSSRRWVGHGMGHLDLLSRPEVYARIAGWLAPPRRSRQPRRPRRDSRAPKLAARDSLP